MTPLIKWTAIICTVLLFSLMIYLGDFYGIEERNALEAALKREHDRSTKLAELKHIEQKKMAREVIIEQYGIELWEKLWGDTHWRYK